VRTSSVPTNALVRTSQLHDHPGRFTITRTAQYEPACGEMLGCSSNVLV